ncbi:MAG TPA: hypothetical protein VJA17_00825 [Candidatus Omnitrophota bacterium]|nr:hypothetical protein [Candidatus Omnitrophota bacterium]
MIKKKSLEFNEEEIRAYMSLPANKKIRHLTAMNKFLRKIRPAKSKNIAQLLKERGF